MLKSRGFTIIELLVVMGILSILFVITVPQYQIIRAKNDFRAQNQNIWDQVSTARSNALTNRKCINDDIAEAWQLVIEGLNNSGPLQHTLNCINGDDFEVDIVTEVETLTLVDSEISELELDGAVVLDVLTSDVVSLRVNFLSGSAQTRIEQVESDGAITRINDFRIVFRHTLNDSGVEQAICLERVGGFPTINKFGSICEENV